MTMLRFPPEQRVGFREYTRSDGTLSYFFSLDDVRRLFGDAGFIEVWRQYIIALIDLNSRCPWMIILLILEFQTFLGDHPPWMIFPLYAGFFASNLYRFLLEIIADSRC